MADSNCPHVLTQLGVLHIAGPDAQSFLQGQLSQDLRGLVVERARLAGLHNPQGRVLALLRLLPGEACAGAATGDVLAIILRERVTAVATHLRRYVLRAKLSITDASDTIQVLGSHAADGVIGYALQPRPVTPTDIQPSLNATDWQSLEIAAGLPEVYDATAGAFVAQMLNLDCLDGISWTKGCYTGQEVIARAHYRGRIKRRMRRFRSELAVPPAPGTTYTTADGLAVEVVRSVALGTGGCELLGVATLDTRSREELPLPYSLPE